MSPSSSRSFSWSPSESPPPGASLSDASLSDASASWPSSTSRPSSASSRTSSASVTSTSCWLTTGPPTVLHVLQVWALQGGPFHDRYRCPREDAVVSAAAAARADDPHYLPDRLLFVCRTGCCRTTLVVGTSSWGSGSAFAPPSPSRPRLGALFCPGSRVALRV